MTPGPAPLSVRTQLRRDMRAYYLRLRRAGATEQRARDLVATRYPGATETLEAVVQEIEGEDDNG